MDNHPSSGSPASAFESDSHDEHGLLDEVVGSRDQVIMNLDHGSDGVEIMIHIYFVFGLNFLDCALDPEGNQLIDLSFPFRSRRSGLLGG